MKIAILLFLNSLTLAYNYRETDPNLLFPYRTAVSEIGAPGNLSNPAYLPLFKAGYINIDYAKPYLMEEINSGNARAGFGWRSIAFQAAWSRFGIREYCEDIIAGSFGWRLFKFLSSGLGISYYNIHIDAEDINFRHSTADFNCSILLTPAKQIALGFFQENLYSLIDKQKEEDFLFPDYSAGMAVKPAPGITFLYNFNKVYYGYINSFALNANILPFLSVKTGYSRETSSYAFAVNIFFRNLMVSYGIHYHSYLGPTHKLGLTLATDGLIRERVTYNKKLQRSIPKKKRKININNSTDEELSESGFFSNEIRERIIKYRNVIGPLDKKTMIQIGMTDREFRKIEGYLTGFVKEAEPDVESVPEEKSVLKETIQRKKEEKKKKHYYTRKYYDINTRKLLFGRLLENDVSASTALDIAEAAKGKTKKDIIMHIRNADDISDDKKEIIIEICEDLL